MKRVERRGTLESQQQQTANQSTQQQQQQQQLHFTSNLPISQAQIGLSIVQIRFLRINHLIIPFLNLNLNL
jgi:hypothetical protein